MLKTIVEIEEKIKRLEEESKKAASAIGVFDGAIQAYRDSINIIKAIVCTPKDEESPEVTEE